MKVLFIGGTGIISSACSRQALDQGITLTLLNRGQAARPIPDGVEILHADIRDTAAVQAALKNRMFDVVVDWVAFTPDHIEADLALFGGRTGQYIFISSASAYQTPPQDLPVTESTPLCNPFWEYSRAKIACEEQLLRAYREQGFPVTIVRPSHTYDCRTVPLYGYTGVHRMRAGKPIIVHGDGTSLWTLTHHRDFAVGFAGLLGNVHALGQAYHITSDEVLNWDQIITIIARAAGAEPRIVHVPSDVIARFDTDWGDNLLGDKAHCLFFDNSKIKRAVPAFKAVIPFTQGAREILAWYDADPARQVVDKKKDHCMDRIIHDFAIKSMNNPG